MGLYLWTLLSTAADSAGLLLILGKHASLAPLVSFYVRSEQAFHYDFLSRTCERVLALIQLTACTFSSTLQIAIDTRKPLPNKASLKLVRNVLYCHVLINPSRYLHQDHFHHQSRPFQAPDASA